MIEAVEYLRLSVEDGDDESSSITNQRKILDSFAKDNGIIIKDYYIDDGFSGYTMNRPSFNRLKKDLNNNLVDTIIVKDLSRLGRHNAKVQLFLENIQESGKRVIALNDNYDTNDEQSHDIVGIQTWVNEKYVRDTSKKVRNSLNTLQKEGKLLCNVPYGYYKDPIDKTKCYVDQNVAPYIKQIFDMYINGMGVKEIARSLSDNNVPTPTMNRKQRAESMGKTSRLNVSGVWDTSVIIKILKNEFYLGTLVLNKTKTRSIKGKKVVLPEEEHLKFENHHEAIIDRRTFTLAQEIRASRKSQHFRGIKSKVRKNIFSGIIFCADCGSILTTSGCTANTRYICKTYNVFGTKKCTNHAILESDILEVILDLLADCKNNLVEVFKDLDEIIHAELNSISRQDTSTQDLVRLLSQTKKSLEVLIEQKVKETIKNPSMASVIEDMYSSMITDKYKEIQSLEKQLEDKKRLTVDESKMKENVNIAISMIDELLNSKNVTKKQILMLVERIDVHEDSGIDIYLKGNLHDLAYNYFRVSESRMNKVRKYMYEYIVGHQDSFTQSECALYIIEHGAKVTVKTIAKLLKTDLKGMMEFIPSKHCYHTTAPIEDIRASLISNIVVGAKECFDNNSDTLADTNKEGHDTINIVGDSARWLHPNYDKFGLVSNINDWIESIKDNGYKYLF